MIRKTLVPLVFTVASFALTAAATAGTLAFGGP
jgi:hypothetical protein